MDVELCATVVEVVEVAAVVDVVVLSGIVVSGTVVSPAWAVVEGPPKVVVGAVVSPTGAVVDVVGLVWAPQPASANVANNIVATTRPRRGGRNFILQFATRNRTGAAASSR
jgi:hypothetical protein